MSPWTWGDKNKTRFFEPQNFEAYQIQIIFNAVQFFSLEIGICLAWLHILFYVSNWILTILLNKISHWLHNRKVRATYFKFYSPNRNVKKVPQLPCRAIQRYCWCSVIKANQPFFLLKILGNCKANVLLIARMKNWAKYTSFL